MAIIQPLVLTLMKHNISFRSENISSADNYIRLEGKVLEWTTSIKHVGNYIRNDLSEFYEIRHKQGDFIGRFNCLLARYHDATPEVLMQLTSSYCTDMDHRLGNLMTQMCIECLPHGIKQLEEFGISQHILIECFCVG